MLIVTWYFHYTIYWRIHASVNLYNGISRVIAIRANVLASKRTTPCDYLKQAMSSPSSTNAWTVGKCIWPTTRYCSSVRRQWQIWESHMIKFKSQHKVFWMMRYAFLDMTNISTTLILWAFLKFLGQIDLWWPVVSKETLNLVTNKSRDHCASMP